MSLMNVGDYVTAREHLEKILKQSPGADYACYGLAVLNCLTGHVEDSLKHLAQAIRLNRAYRFQARNDSDFQNLLDDPRFRTNEDRLAQVAALRKFSNTHHRWRPVGPPLRIRLLPLSLAHDSTLHVSVLSDARRVAVHDPR